MITIGDREFRNLEEQVRRNQDDIKYILEEEGVLNQFGIKVVGQVDTQGDLPIASIYQGEYGDAYAVGTQPPYELYIYTREFSGETGPQWFSIGQFPVPSTIPGPTGATGPTGPTGTRGSKWGSGPTVPSSIVGYDVGDQYLATSAGDVYEVRSSGWVNTGNIRGTQGIQGIQGPTGPTGPRGNTGPTGPTGPVGPAFTIMGVLANENLLPDPASVPDNYAYIVGNDADGYDLYVQVVGESEWVNAGKVESVVGPTGPTGAVGPTGATGQKGDKGDQGEQGIQGVQGARGPTGPQGATGPQGDVGPQGKQGIQGPRGATGPAGPAFVIAGTVANEGQLPDPTTLSDNIAYLVGSGNDFDLYVQLQDTDTWQNVGKVEGVQGPQGPRGAQGPQGEQGPQGATGPQGPTGPQGSTVGYVENYEVSKGNPVYFNPPDGYLCILFSDKVIKITSENSSGEDIVFSGTATDGNFKQYTPIYVIRRGTSLRVQELGDTGRTQIIPTTNNIGLSHLASYGTSKINIQFIPYNP